jgi:hypothetical protein
MAMGREFQWHRAPEGTGTKMNPSIPATFLRRIALPDTALRSAISFKLDPAGVSRLRDEL